jgi:hypothetical protein
MLNFSKLHHLHLIHRFTTIPGYSAEHARDFLGKLNQQGSGAR